MIPNKVKIAGQIINVLFDNRLASGEDRYGVCNCIKGEITIDSTQPIEHQESTFIHEIIEKINADNELELEHNKITCLATQLHQVLKDNKISF
jgi:hypothetical protein